MRIHRVARLEDLQPDQVELNDVAEVAGVDAFEVHVLMWKCPPRSGREQLGWVLSERRGVGACRPG